MLRYERCTLSVNRHCQGVPVSEKHSRETSNGIPDLFHCHEHLSVFTNVYVHTYIFGRCGYSRDTRDRRKARKLETGEKQYCRPHHEYFSHSLVQLYTEFSFAMHNIYIYMYRRVCVCIFAYLHEYTNAQARMKEYTSHRRILRLSLVHSFFHYLSFISLPQSSITTSSIPLVPLCSQYIPHNRPFRTRCPSALLPAAVSAALNVVTQ